MSSTAAIAGSNTADDAETLGKAVIAAVEAGGTSFVVAICHVPVTSNTATATMAQLPQIIHRREFDSSHDAPQTTLDECAAFLRAHKPPTVGYHALGVASFGPLGVHEEDPQTYGRILHSSPKAHWRNVDLLTPLKAACQGTLPLKIKVETDVNAPAMAEYLMAQKHDGTNISSMAYITVGTGIGVGLVVNHQPVHGRMHPEGGHIPVQPLPGDTFGGYSWGATSPWKGHNTVEGLACTVALTERYQQQQQQQQLVHNTTPAATTTTNTVSRNVLKDLPDDHELWDHAANALANLCATLLLTLSMEQIVLGGGLMNRPCLLPLIQQRTLALLNGYLDLPPIETIITTSRFGPDAGLMGTIVLAQSALIMLEQPQQHDNHGTFFVGQEDNTRKKRQVEVEVEVKQAAFTTGLWNGFLVGVVGTALVCKYWFLQPKKAR